MTDKSNTNTNKKHTNKNIPNEHINFQRHKNNTSTLQNPKINANKEKKSKSSLQNNGQNKKTLFPTQYQQLQRHYVSTFNND